MRQSAVIVLALLTSASSSLLAWSDTSQQAFVKGCTAGPEWHELAVQETTLFCECLADYFSNQYSPVTLLDWTQAHERTGQLPQAAQLASIVGGYTCMRALNKDKAIAMFSPSPLGPSS